VLMSDEYHGGFSRETIETGATAERFLRRIYVYDETRTDRKPTIGACLCDSTLAFNVPGYNGFYNEAFYLDDGSLAWAVKAVDFNAYCGRATCVLRYGQPERTADCDCVEASPGHAEMAELVEAAGDLRSVHALLKAMGEPATPPDMPTWLGGPFR